MTVSLFARLALRSPAPVFVACGAGGEGIWSELLPAEDVQLVDSPHHASILVVAGTVSSDLKIFLPQLHDQLPHPRATLWWKSPPLFYFPDTPDSDRAAALPEMIIATYTALFTGARLSEPDCLADAPPVARQRRARPGRRRYDMRRAQINFEM